VFGQDRVNFHRTPGRGTAGVWGLTPPGQTEPSIPYHVPSCWVPVGGGCAAGTHSRLGRARRHFGPGESGCVLQALFCWFVLCIPLICIIVVPVPFVCCSVNLPSSRPTIFRLFLSILLRTPVGGGVAAWRFCCQLPPNQNINERGK